MDTSDLGKKLQKFIFCVIICDTWKRGFNMETTNSVILGFREKDVVCALYENEAGLSNKEICEILDIRASNVTVIIKRLEKYENPLIHTENMGKFSRYTLTEEGRKYVEQFLKKKFQPPVIQPDLGIILITDILKKIDPNIDNSLVQDIKRLGVNTITSTLNIYEFFFLALNLGMITPEPMAAAEAIQIVSPEIKKDDYMLYSKQIYEKLKMAILKMKYDELEQEIFECQHIK